MTKETITPSLHQSHKDGIATEARCTYGNPDCPICPRGEQDPDHSGLAQTVELDEGTVTHGTPSEAVKVMLDGLDASEPDWLPCARTVRACIAALPDKVLGFDSPSAAQAFDECHAALEALLPKPDRAKDLVEGYDNASKHDPHTQVEFLKPKEADLLISFARWLETEGKLT